MATARRKLILTGARAGMTIQLGNYQFVNGHTFVEADDTKIDGPCRYLGRTYKAFEEGTPELIHFQQLDKEEAARVEAERKAKEDGEHKAEAITELRDTEKVPGDVQPTGKGTEEVPSDDGNGSAGTEAGSTGNDTSGHGQENTGNDGDKNEVIEAILELDPTNDEHWTTDGRPRVDAVANATGIPTLTRRDIDAVAEDVRRPE